MARRWNRVWPEKDGVTRAIEATVVSDKGMSTYHSFFPTWWLSGHLPETCGVHHFFAVFYHDYPVQAVIHTILDAITDGPILISMELFGIKTAIFTNFASLTSGADQELVDTNALSTKDSPVMKKTSRQRWQQSW